MQMSRLKTTNIRTLIQPLLAALSLWAIVAPARAQEKIAISYSAVAPSVASLWIPHEEGFFKKHGLNADLILIESGSLTSQALAAGEIGIAHNAGAPAIIANASGSGETIIMGLINGLEYSLVGTVKVKGIEDLKGKRIGVSRIGSSSHAAVAIALDHFKMEPSRDKITFIQAGTMTTRVGALRAGSIDATVVDPSFVPFLTKEGFKELGYLGNMGIPYQHDRNAAEVKRVLGKYLKLDAGKTEDAYKAVKSYAIRARKPYPTIEGVDALIQFFARYNQAVAKITHASVIDSALVEELDKSGFIDALYK
jgi:hypothetical protein